MPFLKRHWPWIVLLLIPLMPLWKAVFMGEAIGPFDQIRQFVPWNGPETGKPWDVLQADGVLQFYTWRDLVFESWGRGQIPFWNPYELAGTPLLANSQSGALYPPHILMGVLHVPTALAISLLAWFHLFWAGFGINKLVRALGGGQTGGVVAGASFILSPFMLGWTALSSVITTVSWIPWMLWGVASLFYLPDHLKVGIDRGKVGPIRRHQWRTTWLIATFFAMTILGGHLQFVVYGGIAVVVFSFGLWAARLQDLKRMKLSENAKDESFVEWQEKSKFAETPVAINARLVAALVFGLLIAAPQLLPVLHHSQTSHRKNVPTAEGYDAYSASALQPFETVGIVTPKLVGDPNASIPNVEDGGKTSSYWPQLFKRGANMAEGAISVGPIVLFLLFTLRRKRLPTGPVIAVGAVGLLLAFGTIFGKALYFLLPGWSSTGSPGRAIVLFILAACVLGGLALTDEPEKETPPKARLWGPIAGLAAIGIASLYVAKVGLVGMKSPYPGIDGSIIGLAIADYIMPAFIVLVAAVVFGYAWLNGKVAKAWAWIPVTIAIATFQTMGLVQTGKPLDKVKGPADPYARIAIVNNDWEIVIAPKAILPPNLAAYNRIHELAGYDSLLNKDTKKMLDEVSAQDAAPPANGNIMFVKFTFDPRQLAEAGVTEVWSMRPQPQPELQLVSNENGVLKYSLPGPGRVSVNGKPGKIIEESGSHIVAEVEGPGHFVLRDRNIGRWVGIGDGKHYAATTGRWIEFDIQGGHQQITLARLDSQFGLGFVLAGFALVIMVAGVFIVNWATGEPPSAAGETPVN